jgi:O-succinylbenzoate synthase
MSIESLARQAVPFQVDLAQRFRATHCRTGLVFAGPSGWGEFAPFADYDDAIAGRWLAGALEAAFGTWPEAVRSQVPVNAIIPAATSDVARQMTHSAVTGMGLTTFKIKVGQGDGNSISDDLARVAAVRATLDELSIEGAIRIDANAGWALAQAVELAKQFDEVARGLDYIEQPCVTLEENAQLRSVTHVRIAIDEGLRLALDLDVDLLRNAADVLIVKSIPMGGVRVALEAINAVALPVVISGSMDTSVGLASGIALAGAVENLYGACGLGTGALLATDLIAEPLLPVDGMIEVARSAPNDRFLAVAARKVIKAEHEWWIRRMIYAWHSSAQDLVSDEIREAVDQW